MIFKILTAAAFCNYASAIFFEANIDNQKLFVICTHNNCNLSEHDFFLKASLQTQAFLELALKENRKVILTIPDIYPKISTIDEQAPYIEGSRVALAWVSAYARFKDLDVKVMRMAPEHDLNYALSTAFLPELILQENLTAEEKFEQCIYNYNDFQKISLENFTLQPYECTSGKDNLKIIKTNLAVCQEDKKRIVITGGAGFLGSYLTEEFLKLGHQVIVLDNFLCCNKDNLKKIYSNKNLEIYDFDISQQFDIQGPIDWIVHLASVPSPIDYYSQPIATLRSGLHGTFNCIQLALQKNARMFFSSTSEVYGDPEVSPQTESYEGNVNPYGKRSQYDQSKRGAETMLKLYFEKYGLDIRIARIFNTYGSKMRLSDGRVITNFIEAMIKNEPFTIYGDGTQTRSFCYATDLVCGLLKLITAEEQFGNTIADRIFNVGNPHEFSINDLAEKANKLCKKVFTRIQPINKIENFDKTDPKLRRPNINKINNKLGYNPVISLETGLEYMLAHYLDKNS